MNIPGIGESNTPMTPFRPNIVIVLLVLASLLVLSACRDADVPESQPRGERTLPVQTLTVAPRDLSHTVTLAGTVEPFRVIELAARTDGVLTEVLFEEGDQVAAGEVVARIDVREQQAELARARARLRERETGFERMQQLRERDFVDNASFEAARAELEIALSEVELWQTRVEFGTVRATIDGTVIARHVEPGAAVSRHGTIMALADLSDLVIRLGVSELHVGNLRIGDPVVVAIDAVASGNPVGGRIRRIFPSAEADSRLVSVEVEIPEAQALGLRPGYLSRAELLVDNRPDVLAVPAGSVARTDNGYYVMVVGEDERLERRPVEPGILRGAWREIVAGLEAGDRIVTANPREMREGQRVRLVDWNNHGG